MRQKPTKTKENPGAPDNFGRTLEARVHTNLSAVNEIIYVPRELPCGNEVTKGMSKACLANATKGLSQSSAVTGDSDTFLAEQAQNQANTERTRNTPRYAGEFIVGS